MIKKIHISGQKKAWSSTKDYNLTAIRNISLYGVVVKMVTQVISDFSPPHKKTNWQLPINKTPLGKSQDVGWDHRDGEGGH